MNITKSEGLTPTENLLTKLCEQTFLKLWCWSNPRKSDGKEICDHIVIFDDHIFIFFDRESDVMRNPEGNMQVGWQRWKKKVIDKQLKTAHGAERYIRNRHPIFLDNRGEHPFPGEMPEDVIVHKIIVAHGASDFCKSQTANVSGSLAVIYSTDTADVVRPCCIRLCKEDPVHVFDSSNLEIVLNEIDTFRDFVMFIEEKEKAIRRCDWFGYCGEEDLLAHYFINYDDSRQRYRIGDGGPSRNMLMIEEGTWEDYVQSGLQRRRRKANEQSYLWDELIQRTYQNALEGLMTGDSLWNGNDALHEMAREPRLSRRAIADQMLAAIRDFPRIYGNRITYMPSFDAGKAYVFLQVRFPEEATTAAVQARKHMLTIACGVARNRFPHLRAVIGIAMDAPMHANCDGEDFVLLDCERWSEELREHYDRENERLGFFKNLKKIERKISDFGLPIRKGRV